jgi:hypothetical protein
VQRLLGTLPIAGLTAKVAHKGASDHKPAPSETRRGAAVGPVDAANSARSKATASARGEALTPRGDGAASSRGEAAARDGAASSQREGTTLDTRGSVADSTRSDAATTSARGEAATSANGELGGAARGEAGASPRNGNAISRGEQRAEGARNQARSEPGRDADTLPPPTMRGESMEERAGALSRRGEVPADYAAAIGVRQAPEPRNWNVPFNVDAKILADTDGTIVLGWVAKGVLWARFSGQLSAALAAHYSTELGRRFASDIRIKYFIDCRNLQSYELAARATTLSPLVANRERLTSIFVLNWNQELHPMGKAVVSAVGEDLMRLLAVPSEFEAELVREAPLATSRIATILRGTQLNIRPRAL